MALAGAAPHCALLFSTFKGQKWMRTLATIMLGPLAVALSRELTAHAQENGNQSQTEVRLGSNKALLSA
jgi:hypothetical protein